VGDEIRNANVIEVVAETPAGPWTASIGPPGQTLEFTASEPLRAIAGLCRRLQDGWPFDATWRPKRG
jgi:hypothetical protein